MALSFNRSFKTVKENEALGSCTVHLVLMLAEEIQLMRRLFGCCWTGKDFLSRVTGWLWLPHRVTQVKPFHTTQLQVSCSYLVDLPLPKLCVMEHSTTRQCLLSPLTCCWAILRPLLTHQVPIEDPQAPPVVTRLLGELDTLGCGSRWDKSYAASWFSHLLPRELAECTFNVQRQR